MAAALGGGVASCQPSPFACQADDACPDGRCEPQGWCSFPDPDCPSGYRFGDHAASGLAGTCVVPSEGTGETTSATDTGPTDPSTTGGPPSTSGMVGDDGTSSVSTTDGGSTDDDASTTSAQPQIVTIPIAADPDDGVMYRIPAGGYFFGPSGEDGRGLGFFGEYPEGEYYVAYLRFEMPAELAGRAIVDARLHLTSAGPITYQWDPQHAVGIWAQASDDAPVVESDAAFPSALGGAQPAGVGLHPTYVRWPAQGGLDWLPGKNSSPSLLPLFDQLAEGGGPQPGAHVQLWLSVAEPIGVGGEVTFVDYASQSADVAQLELTLMP